MTRTERTFYAVAGGYNLAQFFLAPVYPLFLLSRGLDVFQVNAVLAVYLITVFVFEIPTGAVADRFGRKVSFVLACAVRCGAFTLYYFSQSFADCLVAELIDAVGTTLASGALEAWAVDGVRADGDHRPTDRMFARCEMITRTSMIGGGIACGYIGQASIGVPWLVAAGIFGATGLFGALVMREPRLAGSDAVGTPSLRANAAAAIGAVRSTPVLLLLCALTLAGSFATFPIWQTWASRMETLSGEGPWLMGWILASLNLSALIGSALVPRLLGRIGRAPALAAAALWRALTLGLSAAATGFRPAYAGLFLQEIASGLTMPVLTAWTNEHIAPEQRATVLSVRSTFFTLGGASGLILMGLVARAYGIAAAWGLGALVLALTAPGYVLLGRVAGPDVREAETGEASAARSRVAS
jgi:MFS family permease